jgi:hypothetical protein
LWLIDSHSKCQFNWKLPTMQFKWHLSCSWNNCYPRDECLLSCWRSLSLNRLDSQSYWLWTVNSYWIWMVFEFEKFLNLKGHWLWKGAAWVWRVLLRPMHNWPRHYWGSNNPPLYIPLDIHHLIQVEIMLWPPDPTGNLAHLVQLHFLIYQLYPVSATLHPDRLNILVILCLCLSILCHSTPKNLLSQLTCLIRKPCLAHLSCPLSLGHICITICSHSITPFVSSICSIILMSCINTTL